MIILVSLFFCAFAVFAIFAGMKEAWKDNPAGAVFMMVTAVLAFWLAIVWAADWGADKALERLEHSTPANEAAPGPGRSAGPDAKFHVKHTGT